MSFVFSLFYVSQVKEQKIQGRSPLNTNLTKGGYISVKVHFQEQVQF